MTGEWSGGKDQRDRGLDVENNRHTTPCCTSFRVPRIRPPKSLVCRFTVATDNTAASRQRQQFSHASLSKAMHNLIPAMNGWGHVKVPCVLYTCTSILTFTRRQKSTCALYTSAYYNGDITVHCGDSSYETGISWCCVSLGSWACDHHVSVWSTSDYTVVKSWLQLVNWTRNLLITVLTFPLDFSLSHAKHRADQFHDSSLMMALSNMSSCLVSIISNVVHDCILPGYACASASPSAFL